MKNIIHIGYPKTATTSMQKKLFPNLEGWKYLDSSLDPSGKINIAKTFGNKNILLSNERVLGIKYYYYPNQRILNESVQQLNGEKILMVSIRSQISILKSIFSFYYGFFKKKGYKDINKMVKQEISEDGITKVKKWLNYKNTIEEIYQQVGFDRVKIIKYEDLRFNRNKFYDDISSLTGTQVEKVRNIMNSSVNYNVQPKKDGKHTKPSSVYKYMSFFKSRYLSKMKPLGAYPFGDTVKRALSFFNKELTMTDKSISIINAAYENPNRKLFEKYDLEDPSRYPIA